MQLTGHELIVFLSAVAGSGVAVVIVAKLLRKVAKGRLDQDIHKVVVVLSIIASYAQYLNQIHAVLPPYIMGISAASIYGVSQFVYKAAKATVAFAGNVQTSADNTAAPAAPMAPEAPKIGTEATF